MRGCRLSAWGKGGRVRCHHEPTHRIYQASYGDGLQSAIVMDVCEGHFEYWKALRSGRVAFVALDDILIAEVERKLMGKSKKSMEEYLKDIYSSTQIPGAAKAPSPKFAYWSKRP